MKETPILILLLAVVVIVGCAKNSPVTSNINTSSANVNGVTTAFVNENNTSQPQQNDTPTVPTIEPITEPTQEPVTEPIVSESSSNQSSMTFLYQTVGLFVNGSGENTVRVGKSTDGVTVESYDATVLDWTQGFKQVSMYGDPVFSYLPNGNWVMTARNGRDDPRGANFLLYHESSCPLVDDSKVIAIGPSSEVGCKQVKIVTQGKTSQVFTDDAGRNLVFHMVEGSLYLTYLSDSAHSVNELDSICVLEQPVEQLSDLAQGEATVALARGSGDNLLLSDAAIARRTDGTWVLFVKGIPESNGCELQSICELCARSIYRTTSTDLIHWSDLEAVVEQASIPEAVTTPDGKVWLYWQDFSNTCAADDIKLSAQAPISGAYEQTGSNTLSSPVTVSFPDEAFESDDKQHYATNGNPVALPDTAAQTSLEICLQ